MRQLRSVFGALLFFATLVFACSGFRSNPPLTFQDSDLVGVWKADYSRFQQAYHWATVTSVEVLVFRSDGTYQQIYQDGQEQYTSDWCRWWVERFPDGAVRVHLVNGRFYPSVIEYGSTKITHNYTNDGSGHPLILNDAETVLIVKAPFRGSSRVYLQYPPVGDPDNPTVVEFYRESE